jgi:hypothetical protein
VKEVKLGVCVMTREVGDKVWAWAWNGMDRDHAVDHNTERTILVGLL